MDPLLAGITLGTFIKDLVELVQDIKNSIEKVGENKERLSKLRDGVVSTLNGLTKLTEAHEYKEPSPELLSALENLKSYLRHIQDKCQRQASRQRTSKVSGVDTFKSWWKRNEIEAEIKRLDEYKNECYTQFTLFSTARTEGKTVQIANNTVRIEKGTVQIAGTAARIDDGVVQIAETTTLIEESTGQTADRTARIKESTIQITDTTTRIEGMTLQIAGTTARIEDSAFQIRDITTGIEERTVRVQVSVLQQKLEKWLQYTSDMKKKQDDTQELHHEGTGSWFLGGPQFGEWKDKPGCLWMRGNSGTGKSVLSSIVIRELFNDRAERTAVAYFYFDFRDGRSQRVTIMLQSIILQLSAQSPNPYSALDRLYKSSQGQTLPTYKDLLGVLEELLLEFGDTYIVLDALDECSESDRLVEFISRLQGWTKQSLHLLFTSQPREIFANSKAFEDASLVVLSPNIIRDDIKRFIDSELHTLSHLKRRAEEIAAKLVIKSNGMFRLAACLLIELRDSFNPDLDAILTSLPNTLFGVYSRFLKRIHPTAVVYVLTVLRWLCFSHKPITLLQLEDALAFNFSNPNAEFVYDPTRRGKNADRVCKILEGMVTVGIRRLVGLAHASVADYLTSDRFTQEYMAYDLRAGPSHRFLAQTCLGYLLHFTDHPLTKKTLPDYPLGSYAASSWYYHLCECDDPALLTALAMRLLQSGSSQYNAFNNLRIRRSRLVRIWQPLPLCSEWGYTEGVRLLLESGANPDPPNCECDGVTALQLASNEGHTEIVDLLLKHGADVHAVSTDYGSALQAASKWGVTEIIHLLLDRGANVNAAGGVFGGALQAASAGGHTDIVRLLLENDADVNARGGLYGSALHAASMEGHTDTVRLLLENGADVAKGGLYGSTLWVASIHGHTDTVRLLLENGAAVNVGGATEVSPLIVASYEGHTETVHVLLENGANVNAAGREDGSALQAACRRGHTGVARLLLGSGADVNAVGGDFSSALHAASKGGHTDTVRLLLENGADVDAADGEDGSALHAASKGGHTDIVRLLLENGADVNAADGEDGSALHAASKGGHTNTVRLLLENGADVNAADGEDGSALHAASKGGHTDTVRLLLENGADVNAADGEDGSALQAACRRGHTVVARLLLADVNAVGGDFGSALHAASKGGHTDTVHLLLENGADVNGVGGDFSSALHAASMGGHTDTVHLLLENGADVNGVGGDFSSALHAASVACWLANQGTWNADEIIRILRENGAYAEDTMSDSDIGSDRATAGSTFDSELL